MKIKIRQKLLLFSFITLAAIAFTGHKVYIRNQRVLNSEQSMQQIQQTIYESHNLLSLGKEVVNAAMAFVITTDSSLLQPLHTADEKRIAYAKQLRQLSRGDPGQQQRLDSLNLYMHKCLDFSFQIVTLRNEQGLSSALSYASDEKDKVYTAHMAKITEAFQQEERLLLDQQKQIKDRSLFEFNRLSVVMYILAAIFIIFLLFAAGSYLLQNKEKEKRAAELVIANKELAFQNEEKEKRAAELIVANRELAFQNEEKEKRAAELIIANGELAFQNEEKEKRAAELIIANGELAFQNDEKEKRAAELTIANEELAFQNKEKGRRAEQLAIANKELAFQNEEKGKRAEELTIANKELAFQNEEKGKRAEELTIANKELAFQNEEKGKRAAELTIANKELAFQNEEKGKRAAELTIANKNLALQYEGKRKHAAGLIIADKEPVSQQNEEEECESELTIANEQLAFQNEEKGKREAELTIANQEMAFQNEEKGKRAAELTIANEALAFQNEEKGKRAAELTIANEALAFQNEEKGKRAAELTIANKELAVQNLEKEARAVQLHFANQELKKVEADIRKLNAELEEKIYQRTAKLESVNKDLEAFSFSVAHDLHAPLRAVKGYVTMLQEDFGPKFSPEANRIMKNIIKNSARMGQLIDDLLSFSRIGKKELVKKHIPMQEMVSTLCSEIKEENKDRNIQFELTDLQPAHGDLLAIKQVWINLLSNSVKYTKLNKNTIIEIGSKINGNEIIYFVKDNGVGFDMAYIKKLFGVFHRLHTEEEFEGTGVGLAIVDRIVSKHMGRVWAEAKVNEGATFYFSLPKNGSS